MYIVFLQILNEYKIKVYRRKLTLHNVEKTGLLVTRTNKNNAKHGILSRIII